jgi:Ca-activated chloride channel homolog
MNGIQAVMNFPAAPAGRLRSIVLITDGYIGNDNEILAAVRQHLKPGNRLYSFGVGSSTNRFLLNRIAEIGRGTCQVVRHDESTEEVAEKFFRQINNPVLTNIQVSWEGAGENPVIYPAILPDLFAEQPLVLFGRKRDRLSGNLLISGVVAGGKQYQKTFNLIFEERGNPAIAQLWGRSRIKDLMLQMLDVETKTGVEAVTETALTYQLLSQYTAFVAVSDDVRVSPAENSLSMQVPVEMPEGMISGSLGGFAYNAPAAPPPPMARMRSISMPMPIASMPPSPSMAPMSQSANMPSAPAKSFFAKAQEAVSQMFGKNQPIEAEEFDLPNEPADNNCQLEVVSATGLDPAGIVAITQYLQQLKLPTGFSGVIVFEFTVKKGRVGRIVIDEEASTLLDRAVVEVIKRSISTWNSPPSATGTVRLTLRIK